MCVYIYYVYTSVALLPYLVPFPCSPACSDTVRTFQPSTDPRLAARIWVTSLFQTSMAASSPRQLSP